MYVHTLIPKIDSVEMNCVLIIGHFVSLNSSSDSEKSKSTSQTHLAVCP